VEVTGASKPLYEVLVVENTPAGSVVVTVDAVDDDEGDNGLIDFQFAVSTQESASSRVFAINNNTGQIVVKVNKLVQVHKLVKVNTLVKVNKLVQVTLRHGALQLDVRLAINRSRHVCLTTMDTLLMSLS